MKIRQLKSRLTIGSPFSKVFYCKRYHNLCYFINYVSEKVNVCVVYFHKQRLVRKRRKGKGGNVNPLAAFLCF